MTNETMNKRIGWCTDIHLDFVEDKIYMEFISDIIKANLDALLVTGDIGNADNIDIYLRALNKDTGIPIYFILGNHDFYNGSIIRTRKKIGNLCYEMPELIWVTTKGVMELSPSTVLIGHDSWADGRLGNYWNSNVMLNDYIQIEELSDLTKQERLNKLHQFGNEAANYLSNFLKIALENYDRIILMTHAPPFKEACSHEGKMANDDYLPHFACKIVGDVISRKMLDNKHVNLLVLCGHTHDKVEVDIMSNVKIKTGKADYGSPVIQEIIYI